MTEPVVVVDHLTKAYGNYVAVNDLSFSLKPGEIFGLLGSNGAGKTTTIQMLLGLTTYDSGSIQYFGKDFSQNREYCLSRMNFGSAYAEMQGRLTAWQNMRIYAGLYQIPDMKNRIDELLELFSISHIANHLFWKLSSGQQTRAILARSLLNRPKLLLMDEPTASLDPEIVDRMIDIIRELRDKEGVSIIFTSHNMNEVARLCDRVLFLHLGKQVALDTPANLTKLVSNAKLTVQFEAPKKKVDSYLATMPYAYKYIRPQLLEIDVPESEIAAVLFGFKKHEVFINEIEIGKPTLEDVFLNFARNDGTIKEK